MSSNIESKSSFSEEGKGEKQDEEDFGEDRPVFRLKHDMRPLEDQKKSADDDIRNIEEEIETCETELHAAESKYLNRKNQLTKADATLRGSYDAFEVEPSKYSNDNRLKELIPFREEFLTLEKKKSNLLTALDTAKLHRHDLDATTYDALQLIKQLKLEQETTRKEFAELNVTVEAVEGGIKEVKEKMKEYTEQMTRLNQEFDEVEKKRKRKFSNFERRMQTIR